MISARPITAESGRELLMPFAAADQVGSHAVMFESPELSRCARIRPALRQRSTRPCAACTRRPVAGRNRPARNPGRRPGKVSIITPATFSGAKPRAVSRGEESFEARVLLPIAIRKGRVDDRRVEIDDPGFLTRHAAGLLRAQCAPVKPTLETDHAQSSWLPPTWMPMRAGEFEGALGGLRTGGQQKHLVAAPPAPRPARHSTSGPAPRSESSSCAAARSAPGP